MMRYQKCLQRCAKTPDITGYWSSVNWLTKTTPDQTRIEEVLATKADGGSVLHVGVGNSSLARRFRDKFSVIDGITLGAEELSFAAGLGIPNYNVRRMNKYDESLSSKLGQYDFIVDNNLSSWACCVHHFHAMMENYRKLLKPNGCVLTDEAGMGHAPNNPDWNITADIRELGKQCGFFVSNQGSVYSLTRPQHDVTVIITSCGRHDLLARTLSSFYKFNTYPVAKIIVLEDGAKRPNLLSPNLLCVVNGERLGQIRSIDKAYSLVETPYIFHCEDDWEFYKEGFIEKSIAVLEAHADILQVWLRAHDDTNNHPIEKLEQYSVPTMVRHYGDGLWGGFSWNPGLRRTADYKRIGTFQNFFDGTSACTESRVGQNYRDLGYTAAILPERDGYVRHIGWNAPLPKMELANNVPFSNPEAKRVAKRDLLLTKLLLDGLGIPFWLAAGSMLGAVREKDFIPHDSDIDLGVWDSVPQQYRIKDALLAHGFRLANEFGEEGKAGHQYAFFTPGGVYIDIFFFTPAGNRCWSPLWVDGSCKRCFFPMISGLTSVDFCGVKFSIPANYEEVLVAEYGENWRVPEPNWVWQSSMRNLEK